MKVECINAVQRAIGREITLVEQRGIEDKIRDTMRRLAARDPRAWAAMPREARLRAAADAAAADLTHDAQLRADRAAMMVEAHQRHVPEVEAAGKRGFEVIQHKLDQADAYVKGVQREYWRQALDAMDYATRQDSGPVAMRAVRWISRLENPERSLAFVREVFRQDTGDAGAKAAARAWIDTVENIRQRFNAAGGDVRKLAYGYLPQMHDAARVLKAGLVQWVNDVLPMIDKSRFVTENGRPMTDAEIGEALEQAWRTISSDGWAGIEPGVFRGEGALANAGSQSRTLHFKDAESYVGYLGKYASGSVFDALNGHVDWMARNVGLVETFGPNPSATFRAMWDTAKQAGGVDRVALLMNTEDMWRTLTGAFNNPASQRAARIGQTLRNIQVFGKLQATLLSSLTDVPTYFVSLGYNRLPFWQGATNLVRAFGPGMREWADLARLVAESKISDMNRWAESHIGHGWDAQIANATMKVSFLNAWTDALRRGFSVTMMGGMARISRTPWQALEAGDRARLSAKGWTPEEWAVVNQATPETWRSTPMLTPGSVHRIEGVDTNMRQRVASRLLGHVVDESEFASLGPDLATRTLQSGGLERGTGKGELWRSVMLFKSFPVSMLTRHWGRVLNGDMTPAGRVAYGSSLAFGMTLFGALTIQLNDLKSGRDPRDMTGDGGEDPGQLVKFWAAAFAQGGGLGFLGDMLMTGLGRHGQSGASAAVGGLAGPVVGSAFELVYDVGLENLREAAQGRDTHAGAEAFRWARGHLPGVNLWYGKLVLDQAVLNQAQEALSPGYLGKMRRRMEREWRSSWWWEPTDTGLATGDMSSPARSPSFEDMVGG